MSHWTQLPENKAKLSKVLAIRWAGASRRLVTEKGYVRIRTPGRGAKGYTYEHVLVAEATLGRRLGLSTDGDREMVHHVDERPANNERSNFVICTNAYHRLLHARMRALAACGNPNAKRCRVCKGYDNQGSVGACGAHRECAAAKSRARRVRIRAIAQGIVLS